MNEKPTPDPCADKPAPAPEHDDVVRDLRRKAGLDPRGIAGNRIIAIRPR